MRQFDIPSFYRSATISALKKIRQKEDRYKKDNSPTVIDLGALRFKLARHFGFCFGVENAIEIAYQALAENRGRPVYLLSEMIHNPSVNRDLKKYGIRFIQKTDGTPLLPLSDIGRDDVVIVPAFGATVEVMQKLRDKGANLKIYNTTCPFVERVWNRAQLLGKRGFTVILHGQERHEETRATYSHARLAAPTIIIRDIEEARQLADFICSRRPKEEFFRMFRGRYSEGFDPQQHLQRIGVVNQTTMLVAETEAISNYLRSTIVSLYGQDDMAYHFADTRDTLCYATTENQTATAALIASGGDAAIIVGGYNSSNTSHLVELFGETEIPSYHIKDADEIIDLNNIQHLDFVTGKIVTSHQWLPAAPLQKRVEILIAAGASCPDALVEQVIEKIAAFYGVAEQLQTVLEKYNSGKHNGEHKEGV